MNDSEAQKEFQAGQELFALKSPHKALAHFNRAVELDNSNPLYLSYLGLSIAAAEKKWDHAEEMCLSAVRLDRTQPQLYLNLAEFYSLAGKKADAVETLLAGMSEAGRDARLIKFLRKLGVRRPPVVPFLDRDHFVNRQLGKLRYRLLRSMGRAEL